MEDEEYRALIEQAHQVRELTKHPGWDVLVDFLRFAGGGAARRQLDLVNGVAKNFPDYTERVGWLKGVDYAIDAPARLEQQVTSARLLRAEIEAAKAQDESSLSEV